MRIECAKNTRPLGVRGQGEGAYVFCPVLTTNKVIAYNKDRVTMAECQNCEHYRGVHEAISAVPSETTSHRTPIMRPARKRIVLSDEDIKQFEASVNKWLADELARIVISGKNE